MADSRTPAQPEPARPIAAEAPQLEAAVRETLPLWIVTGFLGSGKTTLIRALLESPQLGRLAVVVNEFGEVGLDHDLVEASSDEVVMLAGGCLCCMVRGDLIETLTDLFARRAAGVLPPFDGVVVETSGLVDPGPVLEMLRGAPAVTSLYRLRAVVTVVDAAHAGRAFDEGPLAAAQVAAADLVVLSKTDLCPASMTAGVESLLHRTAPDAPIHKVVQGRREELSHLMTALAEIETTRLQADAAAMTGPQAPVAAQHDLSDIRAHSIEFDGPLEPTQLEPCISLLKALAGQRLLRGKALLILREPLRPVVLQAVYEMVYPPMPLSFQPHGGQRSRMVLITRGVDRTEVEQLGAEHGLPSNHVH